MQNSQLDPLKIICLEEHISDPDLAAVSAAIARHGAPYRFDTGTMYRDDPAAEPQDRPRLEFPGRAVKLTSESTAERLQAMDANGMNVQVLSYAQATQAASAEMAQTANNRLAAIVRETPERFAGFCTLPWQDVSAAVSEAERCYKELGLRAVMLAGHPAEESLVDDSQFEPILAKLAELSMPLYIHPGPPMLQVQRLYYAGFNKEAVARLSLFGWGWHNEAGIQVLRLILSGALDRYRNLRLISGHWGEMVPFFLQRLDDTMPPGVTGLERTISQTYRDQVYVTPSGMLNMPHFRFCHEVLGAERIMFSVDYPFLTMTGARRWLEALPVSEQERAMIAYKNAETLLCMR